MGLAWSDGGFMFAFSPSGNFGNPETIGCLMLGDHQISGNANEIIKASGTVSWALNMRNLLSFSTEMLQISSVFRNNSLWYSTGWYFVFTFIGDRISPQNQKLQWKQRFNFRQSMVSILNSKIKFRQGGQNVFFVISLTYVYSAPQSKDVEMAELV